MSGSIDYREGISPEKFYEQYYGESGLDERIVIELLNHVAQELRLPVTKLRPEDRFAVELAPRKGGGWDSGYGILLYEIQRHAKRKGIHVDRKICTIDDYLRVMSAVY
ncbi:hypothetical protein [Stenotrophomonas maltophilia]|uniref:hypothetical protein n=1 Tax=Stenotrophomonas maltophilia TaxID=40324 RepID=UPI002B1D6765|nr:hypothetical protein [Stenotrophomonas maltophilia]